MNDPQHLVECLQRRVDRYRATITLIRKVAAQTTAAGLELCLGPDGLDLDNLTHEQAIVAMRIFGGRWEKVPGDSGIHYTQKIGEVEVRLYNAAPPPACRIVEEQEYVPPQAGYYRKKLKVVCPEQSKGGMDE